MSTPVEIYQARDGETLKLAWYNVGFQNKTMEGKLGVGKMQSLARDIREAFSKHNLDVLCLCELGEHTIGLHTVKNWKGSNQEDILKELLVFVDQIEGGHPLHLQLISGYIPHMPS